MPEGSGMTQEKGSGEVRTFRVEGRVQGVGFRAWTCRRARMLGLRGWVRNLPDGAVEVQVLGGKDVLTLMEAELLDGPPGARVVRIIPQSGAEDVSNDGFEVR